MIVFQVGPISDLTQSIILQGGATEVLMKMLEN